MTVKYGDGGRLRSGTDAGKLVAKYVHSGNTVIQPTALDLVTGIWTTTQSLNTLLGANGTAYAVISKCVTYTNNIIPRELLENSSHKIYVISNTTFYIQNVTTNLTSYPNVNNSTIDVTKISFEFGAPTQIVIDISSYNLSEFYFTAMGCRGRTAGWSYAYVQGTSDAGAWSNAITIADGRDFQTQYHKQYSKYDVGTGIFIHQGIQSVTKIWNSSAGTWTVNGQNEYTNRFMENLPNFKYESVKLLYDVANGYTLEVYDLKG